MSKASILLTFYIFAPSPLSRSFVGQLCNFPLSSRKFLQEGGGGEFACAVEAPDAHEGGRIAAAEGGGVFAASEEEFHAEGAEHGVRFVGVGAEGEGVGEGDGARCAEDGVLHPAGVGKESFAVGGLAFPFIRRTPKRGS